MFAKIFAQIYDSSIVEAPETRFTFMDFLVLADCNGVVDMTHEAISRRTNRPLELIKKTVSELESADTRSRTKTLNGARIRRLDKHRDWGWEIVNYDYFRKVASEEQRREKTKVRTRNYRSRKPFSDNGCDASVTQCDAPLRNGDDSPSTSASLIPSASGEEDNKKRPNSEAQVASFCRSIGLTETDGQYYWSKWQGNGFKNAGKVMLDWRATVRSHKLAGYCPSQRQKPNGFHKQLQPSSRQSKIDIEYEQHRQRMAERKQNGQTRA